VGARPGSESGHRHEGRGRARGFDWLVPLSCAV